MFNYKFIAKASAVILLITSVILSACNKELPNAVPITPEAPIATETILQKLDAAEFSILKAAVEKASTFASTTGKISDILGNPNATVTFFAPDNAALLRSFALLGLPADPASLNFFSAGKLDTLLKYHLIGGEAITTARINPVAPGLNLYLQSMLLLAPPSAAAPPGYRMPLFFGKQATAAFANNIPVTMPDIITSNGVMHKIYAALLPPEKVLWQTIAANADNSYTYFKAAVIRADGGVNPEGQFQKALSTLNANFTALIPTNEAFEKALVGLITLGLINGGIVTDPAAASALATSIVAGNGVNIISDPASIPGYGPALAAVVTPQVVQGIVAYHLLAQPGIPKTETNPGTATVGYRNFTVNFPITETFVPTLVNASFATHKGVALKATFAASGVTSATAKGLGNATASNIILSAPPSATNDVNHLNGVIHRIDQVLLPQPPQ